MPDPLNRFPTTLRVQPDLHGKKRMIVADDDFKHDVAGYPRGYVASTDFRRDQEDLAVEIACRWNAWRDVQELLFAMAVVVETPHGNTLRHTWSERARTILKGWGI